MKQLLYNWSGYNLLAELLSSWRGEDEVTFVRQATEKYQVQYRLQNPIHEKLQSTVFVSNHPTGALDFLAVYPELTKIAPRLKIIVNKELQVLTPLKNVFISVNPISSGRDNSHEKAAIVQHLESGGNVLLYPAGKVARKKAGEVVDYPWRLGMAEVIRQHAEYVVPIHVQAENSRWFYFIRRLSPRLSLLFLLRELKLHKERVADIMIGQPLAVETFKDLNAADLMSTIRAKVYSLATGGFNGKYKS